MVGEQRIELWFHKLDLFPRQVGCHYPTLPFFKLIQYVKDLWPSHPGSNRNLRFRKPVPCPLGPWPANLVKASEVESESTP